MPVPTSPDPIRALLTELRDDDYVRFKFGKRVDAALKALETQSAVDTRELEARLQAMLELVRGKKGGSPASPAGKSRARVQKEKVVAAAD
jgi:hypothetical protein